MATHSDGNGRTFISLNVSQFIVSLLVLVSIVVGGVWTLHAKALDAIEKRIEQEVSKVETMTMVAVNAHNDNVTAHTQLFKNAKVLTDKDLKELYGAIDNLKMAINQLEVKIEGRTGGTGSS